ncbi:sigma factor [Saccharibacillus sp. JS10]|uniref:sigma factor n=1 Tax=Saccharibacillus sp. JS10 TaxID=2950552 RepID=UPI00272E5FAE|nr:sigma factor [Saccharibacillus sp. JS10]
MEKMASYIKHTDKEHTTTEEEHFFQIITSKHQKLYAIAFSYLRSEADALETVQEATCRAWIKRKKLKNSDVFRRIRKLADPYCNQLLHG